ncbi:hypothetical protein U9R80_11620 [Pseudomonas sp. JQ170C]|uniref:hypothetical protein n=1 Tax=Pseudomonas sp. JQ170C TaxID=3110111 RepID=UPI002D792CE3|nr:hypothetical protein [Pseudomonas sp. 170C]WRO78282.1 hypothetical protein U9R80_11620 [Pseudomonas sp. 170C]
MYIGKTALVLCLTWMLFALSHFNQASEIESIRQQSIELNRQTYNRLQIERSQDRALNEEQARKIVSVEIMRATPNKFDNQSHWEKNP